MSPFKRGDVYQIDVRWKGVPRLQLSTGTTNKARAIAMERTLVALKAAGRRDLLGLLGEGKITLGDLHDAYLQRGDELEQLKAQAESPTLGELTDEWLPWLASPGGLSPRTKRRYSPGTVAQYQRSFNGLFATLPRGRESTLPDLTYGALLDYRTHRLYATGGKERKTVGDRSLSGATLNRDFAALGAFMTWVRDVKGIAFDRPRIPRERESRGRERWLSSHELKAFEAACPPVWWAFFAAGFYTGMRLGETQGLRGADVLLHAKRITVHEAERRVKSKEAVRDVPIPESLANALGSHLARIRPGPSDLVFPDGYQDYGKLRRVWDRTCRAAGIEQATPHDARHTFAVHAAQVGVPIVRLQKLMGHATAAMTMRYMKHAPEAYLVEDGEAIARHMSGEGDREGAVRAEAARKEMKQA